MTSRFPVTQSEHSLSWYADLHLDFTESLADQCLLMESGETVPQEGVREALAV